MTRPFQGTQSGAFFYDEVVELERKLRGDKSPRATALAAEATRLRATFERWAVVRPEPELKARAIRELFDLNRAVLEHLGATSSGRRSSPDLGSAARDDDDDDGSA